MDRYGKKQIALDRNGYLHKYEKKWIEFDKFRQIWIEMDRNGQMDRNMQISLVEIL